MKRKYYVQGPGPWCGSAGGYTNHGCRCDDCKAANAAAYSKYIAAHPEALEKRRLAERRRRLVRRIAKKEEQSCQTLS